MIGGALLRRLVRDQFDRPRGTSRVARDGPSGADIVVTGQLAADTQWDAALKGVDVVVHAAARVHVMRETAQDPLTEFRLANVAGTLTLARQAAAAGVRRFVFLSSIKVNGEQSLAGRPFRWDDAPAPLDPYGVSKREAEQELIALAEQTGLEVVIIRPVLVYGPGVGGNFLTMMRWVATGVPLPFGGLHNHRSLVALDNLVDLIIACIEHAAAAGRVFLVSDGCDLSTTELLRRLAAAMGRSARLVTVPEPVLTLTARALGKIDMARRLLGTLQVDIESTRTQLGWAPTTSVDDALRQTSQYFLAMKRAQ